MRISLDCLGASREVGRSAFLLQTDRQILLDYGVKIFDQSGMPKFPSENIRPDLMLLSHAHLDHSGFIPALYKHSNIKWFATPPTEEICEILWLDSMKIMERDLPYHLSHFKRATKNFHPIPYNCPFHAGETEITFLDAGHISGAAITTLDYGGKRVCYTGDFKMGETNLHSGAKPVKDVDALIIESTYGNRDHPPRKELENQLIAEIRETVESGGTVLLPAFSLGRTQELISVIRKYDRSVPLFVDGMGKELSRIYLKYPGYLKDAKEFRKALQSVTLVSSIPDRKRATQIPGVIVTSAGMMSGGPVLNYLFNVNSESKVIFTGYCVEGTNGWKLLNEDHITKDGQDLVVDLPVEYLDFSAHAGKSDLLKFIQAANPEKVILVHGDKPELFAEELARDFGFDAIAPLLGERIEL
ncbi:MBL fold metallo-hydrolase [Candidatus Micrarchaeota archaeon]|nr:MBL fold metallo-hydrolase [Candidatus Micrarchaeota archaeon]